jgi:large subunit ribosomal protein LP0
MSDTGEKRRERKIKYKERLEKLLQEYKNILLIGVDNVGSLQMQKIRIALRKKAVLLMGKNTLIRMILRQAAEQNPKLEGLLEHIRGNVGMCFTNQDLSEVRAIVTSNKVPAAAKSGTIAPTDVFIPPGPTGLDPGQTNFFQALQIITRIARGSIEIVNQVHLIKKGDKVTTSAVALLSKLDIKPFFYGATVVQVYEDGSLYPPSVLDITPAEVQSRFLNGVRRLTAVSLAIGYPTAATLPHTLANGFKKLFAVSLSLDYKMEGMEKLTTSTKPADGGDKKSDDKGAKSDDKGAKGGKGDKEDKGGKGDKGKKDEKPADEPEPEEPEADIGSLFG